MLKAIAGAEIFLIPPKQVPQFWGLAEDYLAKAIAKVPSEYTLEMLLNACFDRNSQLWIVWSEEHGNECAVVTCVLPHCATLVIQACGGTKRQNWMGCLDDIEKWAKAQGCKRMRLFGRKGWQRVLPDYCVTRVIMDKELV